MCLLGFYDISKNQYNLKDCSIDIDGKIQVSQLKEAAVLPGLDLRDDEAERPAGSRNAERLFGARRRLGRGRGPPQVEEPVAQPRQQA